MMKKTILVCLLGGVLLASLPAQEDIQSEIILLDLQERVIPELLSAKLSFTVFGSVESLLGLGLTGAGLAGLGLSAPLMTFPPLGVVAIAVTGLLAGTGVVILGDGWRNLAYGMGQLPPLPEPAGLIQFRKTLSKEILDFTSTKAWMGVGLIYVSLALGALAILDKDGFNAELAVGALGGLAGGLTILAWQSPLEAIWNSHVTRFPLRPEEAPEKPKSFFQP